MQKLMLCLSTAHSVAMHVLTYHKAVNETYAEARSEETTHTQMYPQNVLYEDVMVRNQEQDLELKINEAYGPIKGHTNLQ